MELLTIKEASTEYKISATKLRELCLAKQVKSAKIGVGWRIERSSLEGYISYLFNEKSSLEGENCAYKRPARKAGKSFDFKAELNRLRGKNGKEKAM